ncbi:MAG: hypothetical protein ABDH21_04670 [bacterium]
MEKKLLFILNFSKLILLISTFLVSLPLISYSTNLNYMLSQLENYYTSNQTINFRITLDQITQIAISTKQQEIVINFIKNNLTQYTNPIINEQIADALFNLGDTNLSKAKYHECIKYLNPSSKASLSFISRIYQKISHISLLHGDIQNYLFYLTQSYNYQPDPDEKSTIKIEIIKHKINYLTISQDEVKAEISQILQIPLSNYEKLYNNLVEIYDSVGMKQESIYILQNILPKYQSLESFITRYNYSQNKQEQKSILEQMIKLYPKADPYYMEKLADIYLEEGENQYAKELYHKVIFRIPTKHQVLYKLARIYQNENNLYLAERYILLAIKQTNSPEYLELAGDMFKKVDKNKAKQYYSKAYDLYQDMDSKIRIRSKISELE